MTTPAQDAPLVFPSVAFRPVRLFVISVAITAVAMLAAGLSGHLMVGVFFGIGLLLGLLNALLVRRRWSRLPPRPSAEKVDGTQLGVAAGHHHHVGLIIAYVFRPAGLGVVFGLALFQVLLVASTALPVWKKLRTGEADFGRAEGGV